MSIHDDLVHIVGERPPVGNAPAGVAPPDQVINLLVVHVGAARLVRFVRRRYSTSDQESPYSSYREDPMVASQGVRGQAR